ncbi:MAG: dihydrodipicolinate synthase family protein [Gemmatimonadales bacterium]|nr:MAG: dihydrodipicolinate synthase family protein [Gemmatimonadales bacterium]
MAELAGHPNIVGVKDSRGDLEALGAMARAVPEGFQVLSGSGAGLLGALQVGACGGILGVANLLPGPAAGIVAAVQSGQLEEAGQLQERVGPLHRAVVAGMGVPGVKAALDFLGMVGGAPRPPLRALSEGDRDRVRTALAEAGLLSPEEVPQ